jgi:uncharacterized peroxidase-related enzyme
MSWIGQVDEDDAGDDLKNVYEETRNKRGKVANILKAHSLNPAAMRDHLRLYSTLMFGESSLPRIDRELLALVVSNANGCDYCVQHHAEMLRQHIGDEQVNRICRNVWHSGFSDRTMAMIVYALKLNMMACEVLEDDLNDLRGIGYGEAEILDVNLLVSYVNFENRIALGLGVTFTDDEVRGYNS